MTALAEHSAAPRRTHAAPLRVLHEPAPVDLVAAEQAAEAFLSALGLSLDSESLRATPGRMARAYAELFAPARSS